MLTMPEKDLELWPIPVQLVATIARELSRHGISTQHLLAGSGLSEQDLATPETMMPYRTAQRLIERACELTPIPHLGLAIGIQQSPSSMGVLGYGINCCATVEDAMNMAVKYFRVASTLITTGWRKEDGKLYWLVKPPVDLGKILPCIVEQEFSMLCRVYPMLTGQPLNVLEAHFQYREPDDTSLYQNIFDCPLFFSTEENQLVFAEDILQKPIIQANPLSVLAAERMCSEFMQSNPTADDLVLQIRQLILEQNNKHWSEDTIAQRLNITGRTLRNQLRRAGTSYQAILNSLREQIARDALTRSTLNVGDIATTVGFSDARSFRRAFKQWTGMTPEDCRNSTAA